MLKRRIRLKKSGYIPKGFHGETPLRSLALLSLLILAACGEKKVSIEYGKSSLDDLTDLKGEPVAEEQIPVNEAKLLHYPEDEKYQAQNDVITVGFKNPKGNQRTLLYWKHRFKNCETLIKKISAEEFELACAAKGISIIYSEGSEFISRIIEYEKQ